MTTDTTTSPDPAMDGCSDCAALLARLIERTTAAIAESARLWARIRELEDQLREARREADHCGAALWIDEAAACEAAGPCPICKDPGCMGNECSEPADATPDEAEERPPACPHCRAGFAPDYSHPTEMRLKACEFCGGSGRQSIAARDQGP